MRFPALTAALAAGALTGVGCGERRSSPPPPASAPPDAPASAVPQGPPGPHRKARERTPAGEETRFGALHQLTFEGDNVEPTFVGEGLVFVTQRGETTCERLARVSRDGTSFLPLGPDHGRVISPAAHATTIAFAWAPEATCAPLSAPSVWALAPDFDLRVVAGDDPTPKLVANAPGYDAEIDLSPDGRSIVFTSMRSGDPEFWIANVDGTNARALTGTRGFDGGPRFDANGEWVLWRANRPEGTWELDAYARMLKDGSILPFPTELWRARLDGSEAERLTRDGAIAFSPTAHPDGTTLVFASNRGEPESGEVELWSLDLETRSVDRVTYSPGFDGYPRFSDDGEWLAFASNRDAETPGATHVYLARWAPPAG